jgi:pimeloyl-ACP methyl ester carboxylesterase
VAASIALTVLWVAGSRIAAVVREAGAEPPPPSEGWLVPTSDGAIFAQIRGPETATPVLLIHGSVAWSGFWQNIAERLAADGFRTIAIDLPPFGYSDRSPRQAYGRADQARRIADVIRNLKLQNTIIVGHSFGAGTVVETVMQSPSLFKGMVLISGALGLPEDGKAYEPESSLLRWSMSQPLITENLVASIVTNPLPMRRLLATFLYNKAAATDEQVTILERPYARAGTTAAYAQWLPSLLLVDRTALSANAGNYASLGVPTSLIWGDRDEVTPLAQGRQLNRLIRNSSLSIIENVGHIPHIEAPDRLYDVLRKELKAIPVR